MASKPPLQVHEKTIIVERTLSGVWINVQNLGMSQTTGRMFQILGEKTRPDVQAVHATDQGVPSASRWDHQSLARKLKSRSPADATRKRPPKTAWTKM